MTRLQQPGGTMAAFESARMHHRMRRWPEAEAAYRQVLAEQPQHLGALLHLGRLAGQTGRLEMAVDCFEAGLRLAFGQARVPFHDGLAAAHRRLGDPSCALKHYEAVVALQPGSAAAALNLGAALGDAERSVEAAKAFARALQIDPSLRDARLALATILNRLGRHEQAEPVCRDGLAGTPDDLELVKALAIALKEQGRLEEAALGLERVLRRSPHDADARYTLAGVLKDQGRTDEASACYRELIARAPDHAAARLALCMAQTPPLCGDEPAVRASRMAYARELQALEAWAQTAGPGALADAVGASQPFYLAYQGEDDVALQRAYGALVCRAMAARYPQAALAAAPRPGERLRIGVVSGYFRRHANWRVPVRGWVEGLDRDRFELVGYHTGAIQDATTAQAATAFERFVQGPKSTEAWRALIAKDRPHVLIYPEIGMDPAALRLAAQRLAPVQCNSWGHPVTSGLPTLDYFLSCEAMEPPDAQAAYSERLVRLPGLSSPIVVDAPRPPADRAALGFRPGACVYWCGQSLYKYQPRHDEVFARIAARVPDCQFAFIAFPGSDALTRRFQDRLARGFARYGLDAERACVMLPRLEPDAYDAAMASADVVLDSLGWSGCNSLLGALACGRPVVTCEGASLRASHGAAILRALGLDRCVSGGVDDYVRLAVSLGRTPGLRLALAAQTSQAPLAKLAEPTAVRHLEAFLTDAVERATVAA